jgi:hypothetical protein
MLLNDHYNQQQLIPSVIAKKTEKNEEYDKKDGKISPET